MPPAPPIDVAAVVAFCEQRVAPHARHQVRVEADVARHAVTIVEVREPWREDFGPEWTRSPIARMRWSVSRQEWTLYWRDRNERWRLYNLIAPSPDITKLLDEVTHDPTCIFWG